MAKDIKLSANVSKQVESAITKEAETGIKAAEKNIKNMTLEVDPKTEAKGLGVVQELIEKAVDKKMSKSKEPATIKKLDKDMEALQKKLDKAGALATQLEKEAKEIDKVDTLVKSNTGYKSPDKVVKTNRDGKAVTQEDIWKQDDERIEKSRKLNDEQKEKLKDLSKRQKQLNTLKENALNTIDEINNKEEKTEEDIIKQYKAAVNLKKVLEEMEQTKVDISKIIGKDNYDETSKITVPKSIIPNKDKNITAKDAVEKYIEGYKLESKLKQVYNRGLKQKEAEKAGYLEDKKFENSQDLNIKDLEEAKKQVLEKQEAIAKAEQSIDNQLNILKQETLNSVEDYLKVADKDTQNTSKRLEAALGKIGTYIGSGGDLDIINNGIDEIIKNNPNLGGKTDKEKELFSWNLEDLKLMLKSEEEFRETTKEYFEDGLIKNQIDIQLDDDISKLEEIKKSLQKQKEKREKYVKSAQEIGQLASDTVQSGDTQLIEQTRQVEGKVEKEIVNETTNTEIPVSVIPEVEPEEFVSKITEQLKGHSVKVDVELNSENITEEVKKITEMIPDKKEIEVSVNLEDIDKKIIENIGVRDASDTDTSTSSATSEVKKQNEIQKELEETDEQVQKVMYHYGLLNKNLGGKETHQFGDEINAYAEGKRNGNRGWADGTGTYVTNDATEFPILMPKDTQKKFFALDASKLKLYEAHIEEEAQKFYEFQHKLEQFVLALGSGFTGFDDNISDVSSETLYEEAKSVFSKYPKIFNSVFKDFEQFDDFIDEMINLVSESGMNKNGLEAKNAKKLMNFKKENGIDDIKTRFLKKLGFQGTDLSGTSYGGIQTGSVIFDVEEAPIIASGKTITEVLEQVGVTAEETKYKVEQVTDAENKLVNTSKTVEEAPIKNVIENTNIEAEKPDNKDTSINVLPKVESPELFAKEVSEQLKGTAAKIDVKPQITDKALSDLLKEQTKSKNTSVNAPKLNFKNLIEEFNLKGKDIDSSITTKVRDLTKEINKLSKDAIETNNDKAWEGLVSHIKELGSILNSYGKIKLDTAQFESVLKVAEQLKGSRIFIGGAKNDILSGSGTDNLRQLNNEFINLGVTFTTTRDKAMNLDDVWDEFIQSTGRMDLADITTGADRLSKIIEELREAKSVLYGDKGYISADKYGTSEMVSYMEQVEKKQKEYTKANPDKAEEYQRSIEFIRQEISAMKELASVVDKVTASVDEKTNAFREEEQVVAGVVQREISGLERLSGELVSVRDDIEKITSAITTLPKIDFDVDMSKLNIENIDGAAIASFNTFREQLAGLEAQLNVSNLSEKLIHISEAFERLSRIENLENLNTKNLNITPIVQLAEKAGSITELVEALNRLKECLDGLKTASFDKEQFDGLKLTKANVNNMAEMAVALETVGIALQKFDTDAKESLSSINELLGKSEDLKNLSSIVKKPTRTKEIKKEVDNEPSTSTVNKSTKISDNISNGTYKNDVDEVTARFSKLNKEIKYNEELVKELDSAYDKLKSADGVENKIQAYKEFEKVLASARNELSSLEQKSKGLDFADKIDNQFKAIANEYKDLSYLSSSLETLRNELTRIQNEAKESGADLSTLAQDARQAFAVFNKGVLPSGDFVGSFGNLDEAIEKAKSMVNEYDKVKTELKTPLQVNNNGIAKMTAQVVDLNGELKTLTFVYNDATKSMVKQTTNIRKELSGIPGVVDAVKNKLKDMAVYWTATAFDPMDILYKMREIADVVIDLNTQMTELAKVSDLSIGRLEERFNDWASTAKDLGATISDTISASADWSRLGYSVDEAERLAEVSILYKNVGDGIDIDAANESLVSTLQGFQMETSQAESIIDSFNEVSNNFAISSGGIGEALQRSAASFYAANTDLNSAIALITATNSVIQDPTRVGNMWKTKFYCLNVQKCA